MKTFERGQTSPSMLHSASLQEWIDAPSPSVIETSRGDDALPPFFREALAREVARVTEDAANLLFVCRCLARSATRRAEGGRREQRASPHSYDGSGPEGSESSSSLGTQSLRLNRDVLALPIALAT